MNLISAHRHVPQVYGQQDNTDITIKTDEGEFWIISRFLSVRRVQPNGNLTEVHDDVKLAVLDLARKQYPEDFWLNTPRVARGPNLLYMPVRDRWFL